MKIKIDSALYPEANTPEECLEKDLSAFRDDPEALFLFEDLKDSKATLKGRIIDVVA